MYAEATASAGPVIREQSAAGADSGAGGGEAAGMPVFRVLKGKAAPLDIQNVDTDMIIPKEYLKTIKRTGLGFAAFAELRYQNPVEVAQAGTPDGVGDTMDPPTYLQDGDVVEISIPEIGTLANPIVRAGSNRAKHQFAPLDAYLAKAHIR